MTHLEVENLASDYLEGQLDLERKSQIDEHLLSCGQCHEMLADLREVLKLCAETEDIEPTPWLVKRILLATIGERKPSWTERIALFFRPLHQPRLAQVVAMAVFSLSILINAFGLDVRRLNLRDLNPRNWAHQAYRSSHLLFARAEKFYYDLRVVYEIESRIRQLQSQPADAQEASPDSKSHPAGTTESLPPGGSQLASIQSVPTAHRLGAENVPSLFIHGRSPRR